MMLCPNCEKEVNEKANFCENCGFKLADLKKVNEESVDGKVGVEFLEKVEVGGRAKEVKSEVGVKEDKAEKKEKEGETEGERKAGEKTRKEEAERGIKKGKTDGKEEGQEAKELAEVEVPKEIKVELVEKESKKKTCDICGEGALEIVSEPDKTPLYRCGNCGYYYGNFMRKGNNIYYDTTHLRVGQYIASQLVHGKYRVSVHINQGEKGLEELADKIRMDIRLDRKKIIESLNYLIEKNILYTYYEPTPDGEFEWLGIAFSDTPPGDTEITR